ncbi:XrtA system polysaccharide deacetylase [Pedobacter sp.]|uniref:XrtA system polysaccharide deacetylase n=1 Tax=Pedobacter sp. TaxID=1411316 RepID=UPI003C4EE017
MNCYFTVDLEEWFNTHLFRSTIPFSKWDQIEIRIERSTFILLDLLDKHGIKATFFVLGWLAERRPDLIKTIHSLGHEIASHGYSHELIYNQTPSEFSLDINKSKAMLSHLTGGTINGYRAPCFSVTPGSDWSLDILKQAGFLYDSSIYPLRFHPDYGHPSASRTPFTHPNGLSEFPLNTANYGKIQLPCSGGAYFRYFTYPIFKRLVQRVLSQGEDFVFYVHPWELDPKLDSVKIPRLYSTRLFFNTGKTEYKLKMLMSDFTFKPLRESPNLLLKTTHL